MREPVISIQLPTYNHAHYLAECIESIRQQTFQDWELIIIDDGSRDETWPLLERYANEDPRIRTERFTENRGLFAAMERADQLSRGPLMNPRASDVPLTSKHFLAHAVDAFERYAGIGAAFALTQAVNETGEPCGVWGGPRHKAEYISPEQGVEEFFLSKYLAGESVILRREFLKCHGGYDETLGAMADVYINEALVALYGGVYLDEIVSLNRISMQSYSRRRSAETMLCEAARTEKKFRELPLAVQPKHEWVRTYRETHLADCLLWQARQQLLADLARVVDYSRTWPANRIGPNLSELLNRLQQLHQEMQNECMLDAQQAIQKYEAIAGVLN